MNVSILKTDGFYKGNALNLTRIKKVQSKVL